MKRTAGPLSTFFIFLIALPGLACAGAGNLADLPLPTPAVESTPTPEPTPAPPVRISPADLEPAAVPGTAAAASEQPGSEPMAKKKKKDDGGKAAAGKSKTGVNGPAASFETFVKARDEIAGDSEKMAALFIQALVVYTKDQQAGHEMIAAMLRPKDMHEDGGEPSGYRLRVATMDELLQLLKKKYIVPGYCGGTPEKEYKDVDVADCTVTFDKQYSSRMQGEGYKTPDHAKYFIANGGSQRPRPIELALVKDEKTGGERWYIKTFSGLLTGVTRPEDLD